MIGRWTVVNAILVAIIVALGVQIARTWMRTLPATSPSAAGAEAADGRRSARRPKASKPREQAEVVAAITAKDLFDPSRSGTADPGAVPVAAVEPPPPPNVVIVGVRLIGGDAEAVVEDTAAGNEQRRVRAGDAVGDYTVEEIRQTSVVLSAATGESVTLWLDLGAGTPQAPAATAGPRPAVTPPAPPPGGAAAQRAATRRAAQREARRRARDRRARQGNAQLPEGVRERLEALRRNR